MEELNEIIEFAIAQREAGYSLLETQNNMEEHFKLILEGKIPDIYLGIQISQNDQKLYLTIYDKGLLTLVKTTIIFDVEL